MTQLSGSEVAGEHALREGERDRLGFGEIAGRIANSIVDRASIDGLVIGLDGKWRANLAFFI
jgi:predicted KAP-like P-loop ATPase